MAAVPTFPLSTSLNHPWPIEALVERASDVIYGWPFLPCTHTAGPSGYVQGISDPHSSCVSTSVSTNEERSPSHRLWHGAVMKYVPAKSSRPYGTLNFAPLVQTRFSQIRAVANISQIFQIKSSRMSILVLVASDLEESVYPLLVTLVLAGQLL